MSSGGMAIPIIPHAAIDYIMALHMPLVDAVVFLQPNLAMLAHETTDLPLALSVQQASTKPSALNEASTTRTIDKLFPVPLLKCPLPIFVAFTDAYRIHPDIVKALQAARRRKVNRKWKRVSRCTHAQKVPKLVDVESDNEGECATINGPAMFMKLMAVPAALIKP